MSAFHMRVRVIAASGFVPVWLNNFILKVTLIHLNSVVFVPLSYSQQHSFLWFGAVCCNYPLCN